MTSGGYVVQNQLMIVHEEQKRIQAEHQQSSRDSRICLIQWYASACVQCTLFCISAQ